MKQVKFSMVFSKATLMIGITFCAIPFFGSAYAQTSGSQTQVLLEMQSMRQEIAELRDMVERQQYELRKMQRELQSSNTSSLPRPVSNTIETVELNRDTVIGSNATNTVQPNFGVNQGIDTGLSNNAVTIVQPSQASVGAVTEVATSSVETVTETTSGRQYPPVVEIAVGQAKLAQTESELNVQQGVNVGAIDASAVPISPTGQSVTLPTENSVKSQAVQVVSNTLPTSNSQPVTQSVETVSGATLESSQAPLDIKPIETIRSEPLVSIPNSVPTTSSSSIDSTSVLTSATSLDPKSIVPVVSERDYYQQGFALLKESKHDEAVSIFKQQISSYPKGDLADDAYYWIAESMYVNRKLDISKENFKAIIQGYPQSERLPDAMLKLAYIEQEQGNIIEARILLQEILQYHPKSDAAISAKKRLADIK